MRHAQRLLRFPALEIRKFRKVGTPHATELRWAIRACPTPGAFLRPRFWGRNGRPSCDSSMSMKAASPNGRPVLVRWEKSSKPNPAVSDRPTAERFAVSTKGSGSPLARAQRYTHVNPKASFGKAKRHTNSVILTSFLSRLSVLYGKGFRQTAHDRASANAGRPCPRPRRSYASGSTPTTRLHV